MGFFFQTPVFLPPQNSTSKFQFSHGTATVRARGLGVYSPQFFLFCTSLLYLASHFFLILVFFIATAPHFLGCRLQNKAHRVVSHWLLSSTILKRDFFSHGYVGVQCCSNPWARGSYWSSAWTCITDSYHCTLCQLSLKILIWGL